MKDLSIFLDQMLAPSDHLLVACGTNEKLKKDLDKAGLSDRVHIHGFVKRMDLCLDAADLILTKAGGLATTEALMKRLPIVYINAVPGCETRNLEFMTSRGYAATAQTPKDLSILVATLLQDPEQLSQWRQRLAQDFPGRAAEQICQYLMHKHQLS